MAEQAARAAKADSWLEQLRAASGREPFLARRSSGEVCVVEGNVRREIPSGLLEVALAAALGRPRDVSDDELRRLDEGPPVEVFEAPVAKPFVVVGGRRMAVRGLPLPHPVSTDAMQRFPEGSDLNVAETNVARAEFEEALSGKYQIKAARDAIDRKGFVPAVTAWGGKAWHRLAGSKSE